MEYKSGDGKMVGDGAFACKYCDKRFYSSQAYGGHQNAHKLERARAKDLIALRHKEILGAGPYQKPTSSSGDGGGGGGGGGGGEGEVLVGVVVEEPEAARATHLDLTLRL